MMLQNLQIIDKFIEAERALGEVKHYFHMLHKVHGRPKTFNFDEMATRNKNLLHISLRSKCESLYNPVTNFFENKLTEQEIEENKHTTRRRFLSDSLILYAKKAELFSDLELYAEHDTNMELSEEHDNDYRTYDKPDDSILDELTDNQVGLAEVEVGEAQKRDLNSSSNVENMHNSINEGNGKKKTHDDENRHNSTNEASPKKTECHKLIKSKSCNNVDVENLFDLSNLMCNKYSSTRPIKLGLSKTKYTAIKTKENVTLTFSLCGNFGKANLRLPNGHLEAVEDKTEDGTVKESLSLKSTLNDPNGVQYLTKEENSSKYSISTVEEKLSLKESQFKFCVTNVSNGLLVEQDGSKIYGIISDINEVEDNEQIDKDFCFLHKMLEFST